LSDLAALITAHPNRERPCHLEQPICSVIPVTSIESF
jgi:hypothetical protein